ncbi:uncharacterized protein BDZ99DRAFT_465052 [Mytilinidion resinicola]|uniref:Uncharacterized protein n=1 Tax=Mytilinidion resinicola TaxID=574789 RepID=A0A6A6YEF8_9PEZI|nr:uncharacterized protein BDZ99DRAFT_465052 [Mytilinidion resinicola]KAF2807120.1 hypothetical protein BDZ99DRAFT_465052 [Mytilinidion resinicola]
MARSAEARRRKNKSDKAREKLRKQKLKITIDRSVKGRGKHYTKLRQRQWVDKIRYNEKKSTMAFLLSERVKERVRAGQGYPQAHLLGIPREVRQQILLNVIPSDVLTDLTTAKLRKFCHMLAGVHPVIGAEMPFVHKQYERERVELLRTRNQQCIIPSRLISELLNPIVANRLPQKKGGTVKYLKLKKQARYRPQRCWKCGWRHYGDTVVCKPYKQPDDDDLGGWGKSLRSQTEHQIESWGLDNWLAERKVDDRL